MANRLKIGDKVIVVRLRIGSFKKDTIAEIVDIERRLGVRCFRLKVQHSNNGITKDSFGWLSKRYIKAI